LRGIAFSMASPALSLYIGIIERSMARIYFKEECLNRAALGKVADNGEDL
jgi:hypothetical protein